jgi:hypothetical protein
VKNVVGGFDVRLKLLVRDQGHVRQLCYCPKNAEMLKAVEIGGSDSYKLTTVPASPCRGARTNSSFKSISLYELLGRPPGVH